MTVPLTAYLVVGALLFAVGVYTVLAQRMAVMNSLSRYFPQVRDYFRGHDVEAPRCLGSRG